MTIPVCDLITCVNLNINSVTTSELAILQLSSVARDFDRSWVKGVENIASLPDAALNKGRMIYVQNLCGYRISDGVTWSNDFTSTQDNFQIWSWGYNTQGQLGNNAATSRLSPVSVIGGFSDWCSLGAGYRHNVAVRTNGSAWSWGQGAQGKLGDGTTTDRSSPVSVMGGFTNWCQASAGVVHTLAVRANGTSWSWGWNFFGALGDNTTTDRSSPVSVVGGFTNWCRASAGSQHSVAIRTNGTTWAWGCNNAGQVGDNTGTTIISSPVSVVGGFTDWCDISAGGAHSMAVRTDGTAWAWGCNWVGQLGDNSVLTIRSSPVSVVGGFSDWCQASAGREHSVAVRTNGTAWAWGCNAVGKLGDNSTTNKSSPVSVVGGFTNWCQVIGGTFHSVAMRSSGTAWAWGDNSCGQVGDNTTTDRSSPVSVVGGVSDWYEVGAGRAHTVALRSTRGFA